MIRIPTIVFAVTIGLLGAACASETEGDPVGTSAAALKVVPIGPAEKRSLRTVASASVDVDKGKMTKKENGVTIAGAPATRDGWSKPTFAELDAAGHVVASQEVDTATLASKAVGGGTKTQSLRPTADYDPGGGGSTCGDYNRCQQARAYEQETLENYVSALGTETDWAYAIIWYSATRETQSACNGCP